MSSALNKGKPFYLFTRLRFIFLNRVDELTAILETETKEKAEAIKQFRKTERIIRELQFQLTEKDRQKARFDEDIEKMDSKLKRMKTQIDEMVKYKKITDNLTFFAYRKVLKVLLN